MRSNLRSPREPWARRTDLRGFAALALVGGLTTVAPSTQLVTSAASAVAPEAWHASRTLAPAASWSAPVLADEVRGGLVSISCPSTSFCMAMENGNVTMFDGAHWSAPSLIVPTADVQPNFPAGGMLSCAGPTFCAAVLETAAEGPSWIETFDGSVWTAPQQVDTTTVTSISCPAVEQCVAVDVGGNALVDRAGDWGTPVAVDSVGPLEGVSCPTATTCVAVGRSKRSPWAFGFDGTAWSPSPGAVGTEQMVSVSCADPSGCMAVDQHDASTYDGSSWTIPKPVVSRKKDLEAVSCSSPTACLAITFAYEVTYNGSVWSAPEQITSSKRSSFARALSCPTPTWCDITVTWDSIFGEFTPKWGGGYVVPFRGSTLSKPVLVNPPRYGPNSLSCPTTRFCAVLDWYGFAATRASTGWGTPFKVSQTGEDGLQRVSCTSSSFCLATGGRGDVYQFDSAGNVQTNPLAPPRSDGRVSCVAGPWCLMQTSDQGLSAYDGQSWSSTFRPEAGFTVFDQSCLSPEFCIVVGYRNGSVGAAAAYVNGQWSNVTLIDGAEGYLLVACGSRTLCIATDGNATTDLYNGTSWSAGTNVEDGGVPVAVACSSNACIIADSGGEVTTYSGGSWHPPVELAPSTELSGASCPRSGACVVVSRAGFAYTRQAG